MEEIITFKLSYESIMHAYLFDWKNCNESFFKNIDIVYNFKILILEPISLN